MTRITLQYFDGCPNWEATDRMLVSLIEEGWDAHVEHELIGTYEKAVERGFRGSPTVLIDGVDPFTDRTTPPAMACRVYDTESGPAGSPTIDQLRRELARAQKGDAHAAQR